MSSRTSFSLGPERRKRNSPGSKRTARVCPGLLHHLETRGSGYYRVLFWAYRYHQSFFGLPLVAERSVLLPTAEEDPAIRMGVLETFFALPRGYLFLTPEEADLVGNRIAGELPPSEIIGTGLDPEVAADSPAALREIGVVPPYVLYLGRIDPNKGCDSLFRYFTAYANAKENPPQLVIAGQAAMPIPGAPLDQGARLCRCRDAQGPAVGGAAAGSPLALREPLHRRARGLEPRSVRYWSTAAAQCCSAKRDAPTAVYTTPTSMNSATHSTSCSTIPASPISSAPQGKAYVESQYRWPTVMRKIESFLSRI